MARADSLPSPRGSVDDNSLLFAGMTEAERRKSRKRSAKDSAHTACM